MTTQNESQNDEKENLLQQIARDVKSINRKVEEILEEIQDYREGHENDYYRAWDLDEIEHWVLGWGPSVKVLSPKELVQRVSSKLRSAARTYRKTVKNNHYRRERKQDC